MVEIHFFLEFDLQQIHRFVEICLHKERHIRTIELLRHIKLLDCVNLIRLPSGYFDKIIHDLPLPYPIHGTKLLPITEILIINYILDSQYYCV